MTCPTPNSGALSMLLSPFLLSPAAFFCHTSLTSSFDLYHGQQPRQHMRLHEPSSQLLHLPCPYTFPPLFTEPGSSSTARR